MRDPFLMMYQTPESCPKMVRAAVLTEKLRRYAKWGGFGGTQADLYDEYETKTIQAAYEEALDLLLHSVGDRGKPQDTEDINLAEDLLIQLMGETSHFRTGILEPKYADEQKWIEIANDPIFDDPGDDFCKLYYEIAWIFQSRERNVQGESTKDADRALHELLQLCKPLINEFEQKVYCPELQCRLSDAEMKSQKETAFINAILKYSSGPNVEPEQFMAWELSWAMKKPKEKRSASAPEYVKLTDSHVRKAHGQHELVSDKDKLITQGFDIIESSFKKERDIEKAKQIWEQDIEATYKGVSLSTREAVIPEAHIDRNAVSRYRKLLRPVTKMIFEDQDGDLCIAEGYNEYCFVQPLEKAEIFFPTYDEEPSIPRRIPVEQRERLGLR